MMITSLPSTLKSPGIHELRSGYVRYDACVISAFVEHTHIQTENVGKVDGTSHTTFIRADAIMWSGIELKIFTLLNRPLINWYAGCTVSNRAEEWHSVHEDHVHRK